MRPIFNELGTRLFVWVGLLLIVLSLPASRVLAADPSEDLKNATKQLLGKLGIDDEEVAYLCPMHSDYTSDKGGKCPRCGMALVPGTPFDMRDYHLDFKTVPAIPKAGENKEIQSRAAASTP